MENREIKKGTFTSVWDGGTTIITPATLDVEVGRVTTESIEVDIDIDVLDREFFTDEEGNEYEICPDCHEFLMKDVEFEHEGELGERVCSYPYCDSNLNKFQTEEEYSFESIELCPHCDTEQPVTKINQPCPECGKNLVACSMCEIHKCAGCVGGSNFKLAESE